MQHGYVQERNYCFIHKTENVKVIHEITNITKIHLNITFVLLLLKKGVQETRDCGQ